jgi:hypothetical protein
MSVTDRTTVTTVNETTEQTADEIEASLRAELSADRWLDVSRLLDAATERISGQYEARNERIVRETAAHFGTMAPAIVAVAQHVRLNVDDPGRLMPDELCRCLEPVA